MIKSVIEELTFEIFADTHGKGLPIGLKGADGLIFAGDLTGWCAPFEYEKQSRQIFDFLGEIREKGHMYKAIFLSGGNHETILDLLKHQKLEEVKAIAKEMRSVKEELFSKYGTEVFYGFGFDEYTLKFKGVEIVSWNGLKVLLSPYSNKAFPNDPWGFHWEDLSIYEPEILEGLEKELKESGGVDIVISHGPVNGILDEVINQGFVKNVGDNVIYDLINDNSLELPKLWVCGHIHEGRGDQFYKNCQFINASILDEGYTLYPGDVVYRYEKNKII